MNLQQVSIEDRARIKRTFSALKKRGVRAFFATDRKAALAALLQQHLPRGAKVAHGSSTTLHEIGLVDYLSQPDCGYRYLNAEWQIENDPESNVRPRARLSIDSEYFLGSVQAVCETGEVIGADAIGSRQAFYIYGPPHVIWVCGLNKLVPTLADGLRRVREVALPLEDQRIKRAGGEGSRIGKLVIYENEQPGRTALILVGQSLGF
jgi:hypothetical protein